MGGNSHFGFYLEIRSQGGEEQGTELSVGGLCPTEVTGTPSDPAWARVCPNGAQGALGFPIQLTQSPLCPSWGCCDEGQGGCRRGHRVLLAGGEVLMTARRSCCS